MNLLVDLKKSEYKNFKFPRSNERSDVNVRSVTNEIIVEINDINEATTKKEFTESLQ